MRHAGAPSNLTRGSQLAAVRRTLSSAVSPTLRTTDGDRKRTALHSTNSELTVAVVAPALNQTRAEQCAGVPTTSGNGGRCGDTEDIDRNGHRFVILGLDSAIAQLTVFVVSPALDGARGEQDTSMDRARSTSTTIGSPRRKSQVHRAFPRRTKRTAPFRAAQKPKGPAVTPGPSDF
jgi:hypothetical protein